jgi:hypothetical protein
LDWSRPIVKAAPFKDSTLPASNCILHHAESHVLLLLFQDLVTDISFRYFFSSSLNAFALNASFLNA